MDYRKLAGEYLRIRAEQCKNSLGRQTARLAQGELLALQVLHSRDGGVYPRELSDELSVSSARIAAMLRDMEDKGWILRREDPGDSRHILVTLTGEGQAELRRSWELTLASMAGVLEALGPEDAGELIRILKRVNEICNDRK